MSGSTAQSDTKNKQLAKNQGESGQIELESYPTLQFSTGSIASGTSSNMTASPSTAPPPASKKELRFAILAHIRAIRTLGRTEINTQEIADALGISVQDVNDAVAVLKKHGVRRR